MGDGRMVLMGMQAEREAQKIVQRGMFLSLFEVVEANANGPAARECEKPTPQRIDLQWVNGS